MTIDDKSARLLAAIAANAKALNDATDDVNAAIEQLEDRLTQIGVGVSCGLDRKIEVTVDSRTWGIGYGKCENKWCFTAFETAPPGTLLLPLLKAPRAVRVASLEVLYLVLDAIHTRQLQMFHDIHKAKLK